MSKNTAKDSELGELHAELAKAMRKALETSSEAQRIRENTFPDDVPQDVWDFIEKCADSNPSLLTAIAKFLKDNEITCAIDDSKELSELQERLKSKRKHSGASNVVTIPLSESE